MKIEVSNGEIVDKLTIIEIKLERISDSKKLENLKKEYGYLNDAVNKILSKSDPLYRRLYDINNKLWDIEDRIRDLERKGDFGKEFIETARSVYFTNDERSEVKKLINASTGSELTEEKSYEDYK
jgi:predicted nuclease with TOPRIM domain